MQYPRDGLQPVIAWFGQLQRLLACLAELLDEDPAQPGERGTVIAVCRAAVAAWSREGQHDFAGEPGDGEHGGVIRREPGQ